MANFIERIINIVVNNRKANTDLKNTEKALNNVDKETKNVTNSQKSLTDTVTNNGGAMKILNQLTGGLAGSFKDAYDASKLFIGGLNGIRGAIVATGIGALVVGVGLLIANWERFSQLLSGSGGLSQAFQQAEINVRKTNAQISTLFGQFLNNPILNTVEDIEKANSALKELSKTINILKGLEFKLGEEDQNRQIVTLIRQAVDAYRDYNSILEKRDAAQNELNKKLEEQVQLENSADTLINADKKAKLRTEIQNLTREVGEYNNQLVTQSVEFERKTKNISDFNKAQADALANQLKAEAEAIRLKDEARVKEENILKQLQALIDGFRKRNEDLDADTAMKRIDLEEQRALKELELLRGTEQQKTEIVAFYERLRQQERDKTRLEEQKQAKIDRQNFENTQREMFESMFNLLTLSKQMEYEIWVNYWDDVILVSETSQGFLQTLQDESLIRSKDLRNAFLVLEKGFAIANIWIDEALSSAQIRNSNNSAIAGITSSVAQANAAALAASPLTGGQPFIGANTALGAKMIGATKASSIRSTTANKINAGIATASILAQTIASWNRGGGGASGGGGQGAQGAPQFNVVEASGTNQLAATIAAQQQQPINAYVVGQDVTTQQALDRNRITNATFL
jgi:hypothetical protein